MIKTIEYIVDAIYDITIYYENNNNNANNNNNTDINAAIDISGVVLEVDSSPKQYKDFIYCYSYENGHIFKQCSAEEHLLHIGKNLNYYVTIKSQR